jgi:hypothetical protein
LCKTPYGLAITYGDFLEVPLVAEVQLATLVRRSDTETTVPALRGPSNFTTCSNRQAAAGPAIATSIPRDQRRHEQVLDLVRAGQSWDQLYRNVEFSSNGQKWIGFETMKTLNVLGMYRRVQPSGRRMVNWPEGAISPRLQHQTRPQSAMMCHDGSHLRSRRWEATLSLSGSANAMAGPLRATSRTEINLARGSPAHREGS